MPSRVRVRVRVLRVRAMVMVRVRVVRLRAVAGLAGQSPQGALHDCAVSGEWLGLGLG